MYELCNKMTSLPNGKDKFLSYYELFSSTVESSASEGTTIIEMKKKFDLIDLFKSEGPISVDDFQLDTIIELYSKVKWAAMHKDLIEAYDYLTSLKA